MLLGAGQFFEKRGAPTPPLPYDYAVEYIETDGVASYIDTGCVPDVSSSTVSMIIQVVSIPDTTQNRGYVNTICDAGVGTQTTQARFAFGVNGAISFFSFRNPTNDMDIPYNNSVCYVSLSPSLIRFNNNTYTPSSMTTSQGNNSLFLGRARVLPLSNSYAKYSRTRYYSVQILTGGAEVFTGIPVVVNGAAGLYDSISGTVKFNAAESGTITAGPRV